MKRLLLTLLCVLFAYPCFAAEPIQLARMSPWVAGSVMTTSSCTNCQGDNACSNISLGCTFRETFNGGSSCASGYSSTCDNAWAITTFTPDFDNTSYPSSGKTYACYMTGAGFQRNSINFSELSEAYAAGDIYIETRNTTPFTLKLTDTLNTLCLMSMDSSGNVIVTNDQSENSATIGTVSDGNAYYMKIRYKAGTGANSECQGWLSTDGKSWGTPQSTAGGASTASANRVFIGAGTSSKLHMREVRVFSGDISW